MKIKNIILSIVLTCVGISAAAQNTPPYGEGAGGEALFDLSTVSSRTAATEAGYRFLSLRTNAVLWAFGAPNVGLEIVLHDYYTLAFDGGYGDWGVKGDNAALPRLSTVGMQVRRYLRPLGQPLHGTADYHAGWFVGADARYVHVNHQKGDEKVGKEGDLWNFGITGGYTLPLSKDGRWAADFLAGIGAIRRDYSKYTWYAPANMNRKVGERLDWTAGLTTLEASLVYRF